jgi:hypothetical protein
MTNQSSSLSQSKSLNMTANNHNRPHPSLPPGNSVRNQQQNRQMSSPQIPQHAIIAPHSKNVLNIKAIFPQQNALGIPSHHFIPQNVVFSTHNDPYFPSPLPTEPVKRALFTELLNGDNEHNNDDDSNQGDDHSPKNAPKKHPLCTMPYEASLALVCPGTFYSPRVLGLQGSISLTKAVNHVTTRANTSKTQNLLKTPICSHIYSPSASTIATNAPYDFTTPDVKYIPTTIQPLSLLPSTLPLTSGLYHTYHTLPFLDQVSLSAELNYILHPELLLSETGQSVINAVIDSGTYDGVMAHYSWATEAKNHQEAKNSLEKEKQKIDNLVQDEIKREWVDKYWGDIIEQDNIDINNNILNDKNKTGKKLTIPKNTKLENKLEEISYKNFYNPKFYNFSSLPPTSPLHRLFSQNVLSNRPINPSAHHAPPPTRSINGVPQTPNYNHTPKSVDHLLQLFFPGSSLLPFSTKTLGMHQRYIQRYNKDKMLVVRKTLSHPPQQSHHSPASTREKNHKLQEKEQKKLEQQQSEIRQLDESGKDGSKDSNSNTNNDAGMNDGNGEVQNLNENNDNDGKMRQNTKKSLNKVLGSILLNGRSSSTSTVGKFTLSHTRTDLQRFFDECE